MSVLSKILETAILIVEGQLFVSLRQVLGYFTGNWWVKNAEYDKKSTITQNKEFLTSLKQKACIKIMILQRHSLIHLTIF